MPDHAHVADVVGRHVEWTRSVYVSREWMNIRSALAHLVANVQELTSPAIRRGLAALEQDDTRSVDYRKKCWKYWRSFLRWCVEWGEIGADILTEVSTFRPTFIERNDDDDPERRVPTLDELLRDVERLNTFDRDLVRLLLLTAARPSELLNLRTVDVDTSTMPYVARIERHKTRRTSKNAHAKLVLFNRPAAAILDRYLLPFTPIDYLFPRPSDRTKPLPINTVTQRLLRRQVCFTLYDCRRIAARRLRQVGGLDVAQAMLGHTRASTTEIYAPVETTIATEAADILEELASMSWAFAIDAIDDGWYRVAFEVYEPTLAHGYNEGTDPLELMHWLFVRLNAILVEDHR